MRAADASLSLIPSPNVLACERSLSVVHRSARTLPQGVDATPCLARAVDNSAERHPRRHRGQLAVPKRGDDSRVTSASGRKEQVRVRRPRASLRSFTSRSAVLGSELLQWHVAAVGTAKRNGTQNNTCRDEWTHKNLTRRGPQGGSRRKRAATPLRPPPASWARRVGR